jgi:hypothetical protein
MPTQDSCPFAFLRWITLRSFSRCWTFGRPVRNRGFALVRQFHNILSYLDSATCTCCPTIHSRRTATPPLNFSISPHDPENSRHHLLFRARRWQLHHLFVRIRFRRRKRDSRFHPQSPCSQLGSFGIRPSKRRLLVGGSSYFKWSGAKTGLPWHLWYLACSHVPRGAVLAVAWRSRRKQDCSSGFWWQHSGLQNSRARLTTRSRRTATPPLNSSNCLERERVIRRSQSHLATHRAAAH